MFKIVHKHNLAETATFEYSKRLYKVCEYFLNFYIIIVL
jgi:hypothetical protein